MIGPGVTWFYAFDRQQGLVAWMRDHVDLSNRAIGASLVEPGLQDRVGGRCGRGWAFRQGPAAVLPDFDRDWLVSFAVEVGKDRGRRGQRHLMLA